MDLLFIGGIAIVLTVLGYLAGARASSTKLAAARAEAHAEASVEVARLQERLSFLELTNREVGSVRLALKQQLEATEAKLSTAETEAARLHERVTSLATLQSAMATTETAAARTAHELAEQRELVSRLTAQLDSSAATAVDLGQRLQQQVDGHNALRDVLASRDTELGTQRELASKLRAELEAATSSTTVLKDQLSSVTHAQERLLRELTELKSANSELQATMAAERANSEEKLQLLRGAREDMVNQFQVLSTKILEEKSQKFTEQNAAALGQLLEPVRERFVAFQAKIDEVYRTEGQERAAIGEQLKQLMRLNQNLSEDAQKLTRALKGDQKTQGTWGEIVLDTVLEQAGLVEGTHFDRQMSYDNEDQKRSIPDVVIRLPNDRQLVVDSKVSLTAYERAAGASTDDEREIYIKQHVTSLRNHVRALSEKNYQQLYSIKSLDFVFLFIPLEPAFATAVSHDNQIFREAWDRNVIVVSPSTLLFAVRTVAYLWRQENQAKNVLEIAKRGAALYDKLCGFVEDLDEVGKRIKQTDKAYEAALRKLAVGEGNVIRQAEMLRDLGVKPSKQLPIQLVDRAVSKVQTSLLEQEVHADVPVGSSEPQNSGRVSA